MGKKSDIDYGPLKGLIGIWKGTKGIDVSPEPDGEESTKYFETITFTAIGDVTNAGSQTLSVLRYHQVVQRKSNSEVFHDETGYWMWDPEEEVIMHSLAIPRAVCVLAVGKYNGDKSYDGEITLEVSAKASNDGGGIIQSPFMRDKARTTEFRHKITLLNGKLSYSETTMLEIYNKTFEHTDQNDLTLE